MEMRLIKDVQYDAVAKTVCFTDEYTEKKLVEVVVYSNQKFQLNQKDYISFILKFSGRFENDLTEFCIMYCQQDKNYYILTDAERQDRMIKSTD
jgi:hypothetical protein